MAVLANPKHERFAQELAKGKSQAEAYELAGYKPDSGAACRLSGNVSISARISELLERSARKTEITVDSLRDMLLADRELARELGQSAAAVSAVDKLGKLYGHMIERKEVGRPGDFSRMTEDELEAFIASGQNLAGGSNSREAPPDRQTGVRKSSGLH
jgi:hypothetical protein